MTSARPPLSASVLAWLTPVIEDELRRYLFFVVKLSGNDAPLNGLAFKKAAALEYALARLFGTDRTPQERRRFFAFAAPIARRIVITYVASGEVVLPKQIGKPALLEHWLARLETFDPRCVLMIDLHYFCGLSIKETAAVLGVSIATVLHDLRFAKRWLQAYGGWPA